MKTLRRTFGILCMMSFLAIPMCLIQYMYTLSLCWLLGSYAAVASTLLFYIAYVGCYAIRQHRLFNLKPDYS